MARRPRERDGGQQSHSDGPTPSQPVLLPPAVAGDDQDLTTKTLSGARWSYLSSGGGAVIQLGFAVVISRLLGEEAFGLIAVAQFGLRFAGYLTHVGIVQALVQRRSLTQMEIRAGFTAGLLLGGSMTALFWFLAPLAPQVFSQVGQELADDLVGVIRAMSFTILLASLQMTSLALMRRQLRFKELALIDLGSYIGGYYVIGLTVAVMTGGVEALVVANLAQWLIDTVATYARAPHSLRPTVDRKAWRAIYSFGGRAGLIGLFEYASLTLDTAAIARYEGAATAGSYNRAYQLIALPLYYLTDGINQVLFPSFSRLVGQVDRIGRTYLSAVVFSASFLWPACAGVAVAAPELVAVVLGPRWTDVVPVLPVIALATAMRFLSTLNAVVLVSTAHLRQKAVIEISYLAMLVALLGAAVGRGNVAYAFALVVGETIRHSAYVLMMRRLFDVSLLDHLRSYARAAAAAAVVGGAIYALRRLLVVELGLAPPLTLPLQIAAGAAALVLCFRLGPLRPVAADVVARLALTGSVDPNSRLGQVLRVPFGPLPPSSPVPVEVPGTGPRD